MPFSWKLIPAAFPTLTMTSPLARTEVCAGAMRVSWVTGLPSATMETQVVFSARISRVKAAGGAAAAAIVCWATAGVMPGEFAMGLFEELVVASRDDAGDGVPRDGEGFLTAGAVGGALIEVGCAAPAEMVAVERVPADRGAEGDCFPICSAGELVEADGCVAVDGGAANGTGDGAGNGCEAAAGCAEESLRRRELQTANTNVTSSRAAASLVQGIWEAS